MRIKGEGSIYYRSDKDLWLEIIEVGQDASGNLKRKTIYHSKMCSVVGQSIAYVR